MHGFAKLFEQTYGLNAINVKSNEKRKSRKVNNEIISSWINGNSNAIGTSPKVWHDITSTSISWNNSSHAYVTNSKLWSKLKPKPIYEFPNLAQYEPGVAVAATKLIL